MVAPPDDLYSVIQKQNDRYISVPEDYRNSLYRSMRDDFIISYNDKIKNDYEIINKENIYSTPIYNGPLGPCLEPQVSPCWPKTPITWGLPSKPIKPSVEVWTVQELVVSEKAQTSLRKFLEFCGRVNAKRRARKHRNRVIKVVFGVIGLAMILTLL